MLRLFKTFVLFLWLALVAGLSFAILLEWINHLQGVP